MPVSDWMGANFTGQNRIRAPLGTHVCEACVYLCSRTSPVPGRPARPGKKWGGNWRNYSHLWEEGWTGAACVLPGYANAAPGDRAMVRAFLAREHAGPWFAALAASGQKHVLPTTPVNAPGRVGLAQLDEQRVPVPEDQSLAADIAALVAAGVRKSEVATGQYRHPSWGKHRLALLAFERRHAAARGSAWWAVALWLAIEPDE